MRALFDRLCDRDRPLGQVFRFLAVGVLGTAINFAVFTASLQGGIHYVAASFLGWAIALVAGFCLNRALTFRSSGGVAGEFFRTIVVYLAQQLFMIAALVLAVDTLGIPPRTAFFLALPIAVALSFFGMRLFVFRDHVQPKKTPALTQGEVAVDRSSSGEGERV